MATMTTFGEYSKRTGVNKGTIKKCAGKLGIDTSEGLSQDAIKALEAEYSMFTQVRPATAETTGKTKETMATLDVKIDAFPVNGTRVEPIESDLAFNPSALLGRTNGVAQTVAAMDQASAVAIQMKQGIQSAVLQARHEYEQIADAAQGAEDQLRELELAIAEGRAVTTVLEMQKSQSVKQGIETQAKIERLMNGTQGGKS